MRDAPARIHDSHAPQQTDKLIAELAGRQHGVVSRAQLTALGLGRGAIEHRVSRRRLHRVHRTVYAVGHSVLSREGRWMAAVLAGGPDALLSHWSAASLWRLRDGTGPRSHVTIPRGRRSGDTITFHHIRVLDDEGMIERGIPVTVPTRVVLDLAPSAKPPVLARMIERIERLRLHAGPSLPDLLERYPRRQGTPVLRAALANPLPFTRSDLEAEFLSLIDEWGLPRPLVNTNVAGYEADFAWPEHRVIVELDTFATHGSSFAFERDRRRDRALQAAGWVVLRVTDTQLAELRDDLGPLLG